MNKSQWIKNEQEISKFVSKEVDISLAKNLELEKQIAIDQNHFDDGLPSIGCIGDARWSKRSYNYNYTANASTTVLIGQETLISGNQTVKFVIHKSKKLTSMIISAIETLLVHLLQWRLFQSLKTWKEKEFE